VKVHVAGICVCYTCSKEGSISEKKTVKKIRHQEMQGKQEKNKCYAAKVNKTKPKNPKDNRENLDNSFDRN